MDENYYKLKYYKYKAKYHKLLEASQLKQLGGMDFEQFRQRFPPAESDGYIYTNPFERRDRLTEEQIYNMYVQQFSKQSQYESQPQQYESQPQHSQPQYSPQPQQSQPQQSQPQQSQPQKSQSNSIDYAAIYNRARQEERW